MEISDDAKGGILFQTRYFLDFFRARGFKRTIDDFAKKANIDEKQPLDGLYMEYWGLWLEGHKHIPYWTFFCQKKLEALKKHSLQQPLSDNQSSLGESYTSTTSTHFSPQDSGHSKLRTSLNSGMITRLQVILVNMAVNIIFGYIFQSRDIRVHDIIKKPETNENQPHANQSRSTSSNSKSIASRVKKRRRCVFSFSIASRVKKRRRCTDAVMKI